MLVTTGTRILEFDYCVDTEAKILQTDLTWCRAADIEVGAELIGFDERVGAGHSHSFRAAVVTAVKQIRRPRVRVNTSHGSTIVSVEHRFVAREPHHSKRRWVYAQDLRPGMRMAFLAEPWEVERGWEAGYLAGFFDGEGWISRVNVGYAQNPGPVLDNVQAMLRARGFQFSQTGCNTNAHCEITNGIRDTLRFLGTIRPPRLMRKARQIWEGRRTWGKQSPVVTVTSVEFLPEDVVIAIETTTGTYISDGFFSHNCGIEAVLLGWFMRSPSFIRLAKLGVHALVASHTLKRPADLTWSDADLAAYFKAIKGSKLQVEKDAYERSKRCVHGTGYGLTVHGMVRQFPKAFPTLKHAQAIQDVYFSVAPEVPTFQQAVQKTAYDQHFLGGAARYHYDAAAKRVVGHPYGYKHTFYAVLAYQRLTESQRIWREARRMPLVEIEGIWYGIDLGEDAKRCLPAGTRVWMADYTYRNIEDVRVGDMVIGWKRGTGPKRPSRESDNTKYMKRPKQFQTDGLVKSLVTATYSLVDSTVTIHFASGRTLRCTPDHLWLTQTRHTYDYVRADKLRPGDGVCRVDVEDPGDCPLELRETAAWLAGFYDGEGSHRGVTQAVQHHGLLDYAEQAFHALGFETSRQTLSRRSDRWKEAAFLGWLGGRQAALKFARWVPSYRYRTQWADRMILSNRFRQMETVVRVEVNPVAEPVYCLTTTTGNFVANDFCSHNCIAFYPQSTARGVLTEAALDLFLPDDHPGHRAELYIGDAYYGRTPLRAPIHDSLLLEVPVRAVDKVSARVFAAMGAPVEELPCPAEWGIGPALAIGVDAKIGDDWDKGSMEELTPPSVASDRTVFGEEGEDQEDVEDLGVAVA